MKNHYKTIKNNNSIKMECTEGFEAESLEDKVRRVTETNEPVEAISPMIYTERKDGVKPEYNIRADKWDIAQSAMDTIAVGIRQKRSERMNAKTDKPVTNSEINVQS